MHLEGECGKGVEPPHGVSISLQYPLLRLAVWQALAVVAVLLLLLLLLLGMAGGLGIDEGGTAEHQQHVGNVTPKHLLSELVADGGAEVVGGGGVLMHEVDWEDKCSDGYSQGLTCSSSSFLLHTIPSSPSSHRPGRVVWDGGGNANAIELRCWN